MHGVALSPPHLGQGTFASQSPITCPKRQLRLTKPIKNTHLSNII